MCISIQAQVGPRVNQGFTQPVAVAATQMNGELFKAVFAEFIHITAFLFL